MSSPVSNQLKVWHGSPHDFDQFEDHAIGSGEGHQTYGHGHYVAENRQIAEWYRDRLTQRARPPEVSASIKGVELQGLNLVLAGLKEKEENFKKWQEGRDRALGQGEDDLHLKYLDVMLQEATVTRDKYAQELRNLVERAGLDDLSIDQLEYLSNSAVSAMYRNISLKQVVQEEAEHLNNILDPPPGVFGQTARNKAQAKKDLDLINSIMPHVDRAQEPPKPEGRLYELSLNLGNHETMDWDEPVKNQHPQVRQALENLGGPNLYDVPEHFPEQIASDVYTRMGKALGQSKEDVSQMLLEGGIKGIRYRDAGSRGQGLVSTKPGLDIPSWARTAVEATGAKTIQEVIDNVMPGAVQDFFKKHRGHLQIRPPSYNYVVFDPGLISHVRKLGMKGEVLRDYGHGVNLHPVDHDPFGVK